MSTPSATTTRSALIGQLGAGVVGGLAGGVGFGVIMATGSDMLIIMIGRLVSADSTSDALGWVVHLAISLFAGGLFAALVMKLARSWLVSTVLGGGVRDDLVAGGGPCGSCRRGSVCPR